MSFVTAVGAVAIGFLGVVSLLTVVLFVWIWANEKIQKAEFEPTLPLSLLVTTAAYSWFMNTVAGDIGVLGVICGAGCWGFYLYKSYSQRKQPAWKRLRDWLATKVR